MSQYEKTCNDQMTKVIEYLKDELRGVRTGRATPGLVEHVRIDVASYGSTMELRELASITAPEPATLVVKPFDPTTIKDIEKGIQTSNLGITPSSDGKMIRLPIPPLSGERRKQLTGQVKSMGEEQKIALRNVRRDVIKKIDTDKKASTITEDEAESAKDAVQKLIKKNEQEIDSMIEAKGKEIDEI
ncbi:MAG TPA: ribosome recycling factor [Phycisphaerae bacterium]|nr:ribosome recycling factor [Phycisphaerales bacterium]HNO80100.1 ribosome recycling factor [Phycisphaerae bacterium]